jgi:hypothetical protein
MITPIELMVDVVLYSDMCAFRAGCGGELSRG